MSDIFEENLPCNWQAETLNLKKRLFSARNEKTKP